MEVWSTAGHAYKATHTEKTTTTTKKQNKTEIHLDVAAYIDLHIAEKPNFPRPCKT